MSDPETVELLNRIVLEMAHMRNDQQRLFTTLAEYQQETRQTAVQQGAGIAVLNNRHQAEVAELKKSSKNTPPLFRN